MLFRSGEVEQHAREPVGLTVGALDQLSLCQHIGDYPIGALQTEFAVVGGAGFNGAHNLFRSEERRVGKECRSRRSPEACKMMMGEE